MGLFGAFKHHPAYVAFKEQRKALLRRIALPQYRGNACACPVCGAQLSRFKPIWKSFLRNAERAGLIYPLAAFETLNIAAYSCPACDASDRERLYALYFDRLAAGPDGSVRRRLVEFAPSPALQAKLKSCAFVDYRSADLFRRNVDDRIDIAAMRYPDASFDIAICSHVLEHIREDRKAMRELYRILRPGGFGIVMVPLVVGVEATQENPAIDTPELRWRHYADGDHLRLYGRADFLDRLREAGFRVEALDVKWFGTDAFARAGIAENSVLYVAHRDA